MAIMIISSVSSFLLIFVLTSSFGSSPVNSTIIRPPSPANDLRSRQAHYQVIGNNRTVGLNRHPVDSSLSPRIRTNRYDPEYFNPDQPHNASLYFNPIEFLIPPSVDRRSDDSDSLPSGSEDIKPAGRNETHGRALDLDALLGDISGESKPDTGDRESRIVNDKPKITGFIPIIGVGERNSPYSHSSPGHASYGGHSSIYPPPPPPGGMLPYPGSESFMTSSIHPNGSPYPTYNGQEGPKGPFGGITAALQNLARPLKRKFGQASQQDLIPGQDCLCVPFYMCKKGYLDPGMPMTGKNSANYNTMMNGGQNPSKEYLESAYGPLHSEAAQNFASAASGMPEDIQKFFSQANNPNTYQNMQSSPSSQSSSPHVMSSGSSSPSSSSYPEMDLPLDERSLDKETRNEFKDQLIGYGNTAHLPSSSSSSHGMPSTSNNQEERQSSSSSSSSSEMTHFPSNEVSIIIIVTGLKLIVSEFFCKQTRAESYSSESGDSPASGRMIGSNMMQCGMLRTCCRIAQDPFSGPIGVHSSGLYQPPIHPPPANSYNLPSVVPSASDHIYPYRPPNHAMPPVNLPFLRPSSHSQSPLYHKRPGHAYPMGAGRLEVLGASLIKAKPQHELPPPHAVGPFMPSSSHHMMSNKPFMKPLNRIQHNMMRPLMPINRNIPFGPYTQMPPHPVPAMNPYTAASLSIPSIPQYNNRLESSPSSHYKGQQDTCGTRGATSVQGRVQNLNYHEASAEFGEYPWMGALLKRIGPQDSLYVCGAALINSQWALTAAHCIKQNTAADLKIRFGEWDVHRDDEFYPYVERFVQEIIVHPRILSGKPGQ